MSEIDWDAIAHAVQGTCDSLAAIAEKYDVAEDIIDENLDEAGVTSCAGCGWWYETSELDEESYCYADCGGKT